MVWRSVLLNKASSALVEGSRALDGGAPGVGGRRLKSGGMTSGALVVTANSSGDFFCRPAARRKPSQPLNTVAQRHKARAVRKLFISDLMTGIPVTGRNLGLEHIIQDGHGAQGNRHIGYIEDIPVIAEAVKVEKVGNLAIDQPVNQVP